MGAWVSAARPRTLPAAVVPVLVGTAAAGLADVVAALLALAVALGLQISVNLANDLFDGVAGIDTHDRLGPPRAVATGAITPRGMRRALVVTLAVSSSLGVILALRTDPRLIIIGAVSVVAALGYSGGRRPYASRALGEAVVFIFFGPVATVGSAYVQNAILRPTDLLVSVPVGLMAVGLMMTNNARDARTDAMVGKLTLAVRVGTTAYRRIFVAVIGVAFALLPTLFPWIGVIPALLTSLALPAAVHALRLWTAAERSEAPRSGPLWIATLGATARLQLSFGVLLTIALLVSPPA